LQANTRSVV